MLHCSRHRNIRIFSVLLFLFFIEYTFTNIIGHSFTSLCLQKRDKFCSCKMLWIMFFFPIILNMMETRKRRNKKAEIFFPFTTSLWTKNILWNKYWKSFFFLCLIFCGRWHFSYFTYFGVTEWTGYHAFLRISNHYFKGEVCLSTIHGWLPTAFRRNSL